MNKLQLTILFSFFLCTLVFCKEIKKDKPNIGSIEIRYFKGSVETNNRILCGSIKKEISGTKDTLLIGKYIEILTQVRALKELKDDRNTSCDVRLQCQIICENGDSIQLCIGEYNCLIKNGKAMQDNGSLIYLIRKYSGYYNYFPKLKLTYLPEIKTFGIPQDYKYLLRIQDTNGKPRNPNKTWLDN